MQHPRDDLVAQLPALRRFALSLTAGNRHLADDLVQDTVMLALRSWAKFAPGTNLKSWLLKILHNRFFSVVRRKHLTAEVASDALLERQAVPAAQESRLEVAAFKAAFAALTATQREALVLVGVQGLAYEEAAAICNCEIGTIKSRVSRARSLLRRRLLGEEGDAGGGRAPRRRKTTPLRRGAAHAAI